MKQENTLYNEWELSGLKKHGIEPIESPRFKKHMNLIPHVFYEISKRRLPIGAITCFLGTESSHSAHSVFSYFLYIHTRTLRNERRNALEFLTIHVSNHLVDRQLLFLEEIFLTINVA